MSGRQATNAWRVVVLLAFANLINFYDRAVPAILVEPVKAEFGLTDLHVGVLSAAFTVVYAAAGVALGRIADRAARRKVMACGLIVWSLFTAGSGGAWSFASLLIMRLGVGIGEASYAPAANSMIADLFPPGRRSRAVGVFQLGLPLGLVLAFFTTGAIAEAFGSWRVPFLIAAVPGLVIAVCLLFIGEPERGAAEPEAISPVDAAPPKRPLLVLLRIRTLWWLTLSGIGLQIAVYAVSTFVVPLFQRYFGLSLTAAAMNAGVILGLAGLAGLLLGGFAGDRAGRVSPRGRVLVGALSLAAAVPITLIALKLPPTEPGLFVALFSAGWLLQCTFHTSALPAIADVVRPRLRATAIGLVFAAFYLLGGAFGPVIAGALSQRLAADALSQRLAAGTSSAIGLHDSLLWVVPLALSVAAIGMAGAAKAIAHEAGSDGAPPNKSDGAPPNKAAKTTAPGSRQPAPG